MDTKQKNPEAPSHRPRQEAPGTAKKRPPNSKQAAPQQRRPQRPAAAAPEQAPRRAAAEQGRARTEQRTAPEGHGSTTRQSGAPRQQRPAASQQQKAPARQSRPPRRADPADGLSNKKRAYGNSKPKKKSAIAVMGDRLRQASNRSAEKRAAKRKRTRPKSHRQDAPAVIYTQPQAFNRNRLFVQLLTVTAVVAALVLGLSVFFKVKTITVSGADVYTAWTVKEASGISEGDNLLTFSRARAGGQIKANLPYVKDVSFGIKLPDTVNIIIVEEKVTYAIKDQNGQWWLINSEGRVVEQANGGKAANHTQVLGVTLFNPVSGERAEAAELEAKPIATSDPTAPTATEEVIPVGVTGAQRLSTALQILQALEANDIVGDAASVNVNSIEDIILWYGTRYQVNLGDATRVEYKIACMNDVILQLSDYQSGVLDLSFRIWDDRAIYTPFS